MRMPVGKAFSDCGTLVAGDDQRWLDGLTTPESPTDYIVFFCITVDSIWLSVFQRDVTTGKLKNTEI
jgi:hypothetical protein